MATVLETILAKLTVSDEASGTFDKVAKSAGGLVDRVRGLGDSFLSLTGIATAVGGALTLTHAITSTNEYIKKVKEVTELTGMAAAQTDFLFSSARQTGVEYTQMEQVLFRLSRRGAQMDNVMATMSGKTVPGLQKRFQRMGVDITKGPMSALEEMSKGVKSGKIDAADLMSQFQIPQSAVNDFKGFLETLDLKQIAAMQKKGLLLTGKDISLFSTIEGAQHRIADGFNRMRIMVGKELLPVFASIVTKFAERLPGYIDKAATFGRFLAKHMDAAVTAGSVLLKTMLALKALDMAKALPGVGKLGGALAERFKQSITAGMAFGGMGPMQAVMGAVKAAFVAFAPVALAVGAAVAFIALGMRGLQKNIDGVGDRVSWIGRLISTRFALIGESLSPIVQKLTELFGGDGTFTGFLQKVAAMGIEKAAQGLDFLAHCLQTAVSFGVELGEMMGSLWTDYLAQPAQSVFKFIAEKAIAASKAIGSAFDSIITAIGPYLKAIGINANGSSIGQGIGLVAKVFGAALEEPIKMWEKHWNKTGVQTIARARADEAREQMADAAAAAVADSKRQQAPVFDFRGSRFDITQNFAEGFDPDRIATSFTDDLSQLGEMRAQSGFAPLYSVR